MRVSSPPSQKHSGWKSTAALVPTHCGTLAQIYESLQTPWIDQRKVNHITWCIDDKSTSLKGYTQLAQIWREFLQTRKKSVNMTQKTQLVSPIKLIQWFLASHFCEVPQKNLHTLYSNQIAQHLISWPWFRRKYVACQVTWSTWSIRWERCKQRFPLWFQSNLCF